MCCCPPHAHPLSPHHTPTPYLPCRAECTGERTKVECSGASTQETFVPLCPSLCSPYKGREGQPRVKVPTALQDIVAPKSPVTHGVFPPQVLLHPAHGLVVPRVVSLPSLGLFPSWPLVLSPR